MAAGRSRRFGGVVPKQLQEVAGRPLLAWTIDCFERAESIDEILLVVAEEQQVTVSEQVVDRFGFAKVKKIVSGGETRRESVLNGLEALPKVTDIVAIHDGARPLTAPEDINRVIEMAATDGAAMLAAKVTDTVKQAKNAYIIDTLDRNSLYLAQTPQVFQYNLIIEAHRAAARTKQNDKTEVTDDAALVEVDGHKVGIVEPTALNLKVTTPQDMFIAEAILRQKIDG